MGIQIHELATKSGNLSSSDYLVTDNGTVTAKIDYTKLAKAIVEQYNGSTIAGSAQTLQSALNGLNNKLFASYATFADAWENAPVTTIATARVTGATDAPANTNAWFCQTYKNTSGVYGWQIAWTFDGNIYKRYRANSSTFTDWITFPSRDEMNASFANYGCKNLLPSKGETITKYGVTATRNADGSITVNGTATAIADFYINTSDSGDNKNIPLPAGRYTLNGVTGGSATTYSLYWRIKPASGSETYKRVTDGDDMVTIASGSMVGAFIRVYEGATLNNVTFYPMIRPASIMDDTYVPYAPNNAELNTQAYQMKGVLPTNTNLNSITETGTYFISSSNTYTNSPAGYGILIVARYQTAGSICLQMIVNGAQLWTRYYGGSSWSTWYRATMTAQS